MKRGKHLGVKPWLMVVAALVVVGVGTYLVLTDGDAPSAAAQNFTK